VICQQERYNNTGKRIAEKILQSFFYLVKSKFGIKVLSIDIIVSEFVKSVIRNTDFLNGYILDKY